MPSRFCVRLRGFCCKWFRVGRSAVAASSSAFAAPPPSSVRCGNTDMLTSTNTQLGPVTLLRWSALHCVEPLETCGCPSDSVDNVHWISAYPYLMERHMPTSALASVLAAARRKRAHQEAADDAVAPRAQVVLAQQPAVARARQRGPGREPGRQARCACTGYQRSGFRGFS